MSEQEYTQQLLPPIPPRTKPLKLYLTQQLPLYLDNPEHKQPYKTLTSNHHNPTRNKNSILNFLTLRPHQNKQKYQQKSF